MFRILQIAGDTTVANRERLSQVQAILRAQFEGLSERDIAKISSQLRNPLKHRFRSMLFVADDARGAVRGFALVNHEPQLHFCHLDFISVARGDTGGGIGAALYERVREEARELDALGLFFECLPDDPALSPDPVTRKQNEARLKFYERYGALPIAGTAYETPLSPDDTDPPYMVFDGLGREQPLRKKDARRIVHAILERKYGERCPPGYIDKVVASFRDDPVALRPPRYREVAGDDTEALYSLSVPPRQRHIALCVNATHDIHHVRERGYVEAPVRIKAILGELERTGLFETRPAREFGEQHIKAVHEKDFVDYLHRACNALPEGKSVYPYIFPIRNRTRPPRELPLRAGYYCIDTFTPLNRNAWLAARGAVNCALTCAELLLEGHHLAYALVRPPGHHAESDTFGGFCYFNSAAIAAHYLSAWGRVALLDIDYHHGNGSQDIFYQRDDVLVVSIHGHPRDTYPYFCGFEDETGDGDGHGYNLNLPLPEGIDGERYRGTLAKALTRIRRHAPRFLVLSLGLDTARGDPTGSFTLGARDFTRNGELIGQLHLPTLVVQEGGYRTRTLGTNARHFFTGLWQGAKGRPARPKRA